MQSITNALRKQIQEYIENRYPKWNLDAALRYLPVAAHLERSGAEQVLDVGSGDTLWLSHYTVRALGGDPLFNRLSMAIEELAEALVEKFPGQPPGAGAPADGRSALGVASSTILLP